MQSADRLFMDGELERMCRPVDERVRETVESREPDAAAVRALLEPSQQFARILAHWIALTHAFVASELGPDELAVILRPERAAELALRAGASVEDFEPPDKLLGRLQRHIADREPAAAMEAWAELHRRRRLSLDLRRDLVSDILGQLYRRHGVDTLVAAERYAAERGWWKRYMPAYRTATPKQRLQQRLDWLTLGSFSDVSAVEQDDRWVITMRRCGTCGRQLRSRYADADWGLEVVEHDGPATFRRGSATVYQTHVALIHHQFAIDLVGAPCPSFRCSLLDAGTRPCEIHVFKDLDDTATEFYESVGRPAPRPAGSRA